MKCQILFSRKTKKNIIFLKTVSTDGIQENGIWHFYPACKVLNEKYTQQIVKMEENKCRKIVFVRTMYIIRTCFKLEVNVVVDCVLFSQGEHLVKDVFPQKIIELEEIHKVFKHTGRTFVEPGDSIHLVESPLNITRENFVASYLLIYTSFKAGLGGSVGCTSDW